MGALRQVVRKLAQTMHKITELEVMKHVKGSVLLRLEKRHTGR